jgi:hypothetical protein
MQWLFLGFKAAWAKLQAAHPVIRWGGLVIVVLLALDFFVHEAVDVYVKIQTARSTIEQVQEQARKTKAEADTAEIERNAKKQPPVKFNF